MLKQTEQSIIEFKEYGVPKLRPKASKNGPLRSMSVWDTPVRSTVYRNWKEQRKTQYKKVRYD